MKVGDREVEVSNTDKLLFKESQISKGDLINYYEKISDIMLPHIENRPLIMHRFPNGIDEEGFYQQEASDYFPNWIDTLSVEKKEGGTVKHVLCNNKETLVYLANQACITPHIWLSRSNNVHKPDKIVFDLDPPDGKTALIVKGAKILKDVLDEKGLTAFIMTTGSRGLHVVVPIIAELDFDDVRAFAKDIAETTAQKNEDILTTEQRKNKRKGRVFIDYLRNSFGQSSVAPYAVRSLKNAPVATPLDWDELSVKNFNARKYTINNIFQRLGNKNDPWKNIDSKATSIKDL